MVKPIELINELGFALVVATYNYFISTDIIPNFDNGLKIIMQVVSSLTSILLVFYLLFRSRKMFWDSQSAKHTANTLKKELSDKLQNK